MPPELDEDRFARNAAFLRARVHEDIHAGQAFIRERVGALFPGVLGSVLAPLARAFYAAVGEAAVERRIHRYLDVILQASRDVQRAGFEAAVGKWEPRALELEELAHRGRREHPRYPEVEAVLRSAFRTRLRFISRFLLEGEGDTYEEAVRTAFPEPGALKKALGEQFALAHRTVRLVEQELDILRFPKPLRPPLFRVAWDALDWYEARVRSDLARIYRA